MKARNLAVLLLMGSLLAGCSSLPGLRTEADQNKYIPPGVPFLSWKMRMPQLNHMIITIYGINRDFSLIYKPNEFYIDINGDDIPDMPLEEFKRWYYREKDVEELIKTSC